MDHAPDNRSDIRALVAKIVPSDAIESDQIASVLHWIDSGAELCRLSPPDIPKVHLVSYFIVVSAKFDQILLVDHKRANLWLPTGGHVEPGEHPKVTVQREVLEELNIEADFVFEEPIFITVNDTRNCAGPHTDVSLWYVLRGDPASSYAYDTKEFNSVRWFKVNEIPHEKSDPNLGRFLRKLHGNHQGVEH